MRSKAKSHLEGQLEQDAAGYTPEGDALGQYHVGVPQDEHHVVLVRRVLHHSDLICHYRRPVVPRRHLLRRRRCRGKRNDDSAEKNFVQMQYK